MVYDCFCLYGDNILVGVKNYFSSTAYNMAFCHVIQEGRATKAPRVGCKLNISFSEYTCNCAVWLKNIGKALVLLCRLRSILVFAVVNIGLAYGFYSFI